MDDICVGRGVVWYSPCLSAWGRALVLMLMLLLQFALRSFWFSHLGFR